MCLTHSRATQGHQVYRLLLLVLREPLLPPQLLPLPLPLVPMPHTIVQPPSSYRNSTTSTRFFSAGEWVLTTIANPQILFY